MKLDNRDLVTQGLLDVLPGQLEPYLRTILGGPVLERLLTRLSGGPDSKAPDLADLSTQIRLLTARGRDGSYLLKLTDELGSALQEVNRFRYEAARGQAFDDERTREALEAAGRTLRLIEAPGGHEEIEGLIAAIGQSDEQQAPAPQDPPPEAAVQDSARRLEDWKRSLLDLTLSNPLINRAQTAIELMLPGHLVGQFEDYVNHREFIALRPAGPQEDREARAGELLAQDRAVEVDLGEQDYASTLQVLTTRSQTIMFETGANNLYLAIGTLEWRSQDTPVRSPLILIPVTLHRVEDGYRLLPDQLDASTPNYSFLHRFAQDTGVELTELIQPRHDAYGIDVEPTLEAVRGRLHRAGVETVVTPTVHLGLFNFSTYRMWRDLEESWSTISANPLVSHLAETPDRAFDDPADAAAQIRSVDEVTENLPLVADATQAQVVGEAAAGRSLVVEGPPGTGKSQTVANLIFRALSLGRTVMFVAEKKSALDVVARRLREEAGIGPLLLPLHDNDVKSGHMRRALREARELRTEPVDAERLADRRRDLESIRGQLEAYRTGLHGRNCVGHSYLGALADLLTTPGEPEQCPDWDPLAQHPDDVAAFLHAAGLGDAAEGLMQEVAREDFDPHGIEPGLRRRLAQASFEERSARAGFGSFDVAAHAGLLDAYRQVQERLRTGLRAELLEGALARRDRVLAEERVRLDALDQEITLRRGTMSIREMIDSYGDLVVALTPCILVSPDSVSRFFPADRQYVDIVVFDEASQIPVADAVGTMGRGRSVVVVGDPEQMPPTAFEERGAAQDEDPQHEQTEERESILDSCLAGGVRSHRLTWHYRSRVESLIAFSNERYYDGALASFPSPLGVMAPEGPLDGHGTSLRRVDGFYIRPEEAEQHPDARPGTNPAEAREIVSEVLARFEASPEVTPSLGIITLNAKQRDLIESLLRAEGSQRIVSALHETDGLFVKNLENVQGDERDTILFSLGFSANSAGELPLDFGPLSWAGGQKRLNVAITRARRQVIVVASFDPEDLHLDEASPQGLKDLRAYMEQARGNQEAGGAAPQGQAEAYREEIAGALREAGLEVRSGVGHSAFVIDLVLSGGPGERPRVAVLLDGPDWERRTSVTDRDLIPVDVLGQMGWERVERVWTPEWVRDRQAVIDRLVQAARG
ncbi:DUF4011 domain-containing protein [Actinomyces slackii]|uniref:Putative DNA helicase n=1 Tax=Actinomyces slackii TaxID=52774 RepID=A0A3S4U121_9ACTO|nr:DUF4011 domain-containing protein [Actinomyces slackii]VEG73839.1 putative DNA helicase [Actinomyces slackii]